MIMTMKGNYVLVLVLFAFMSARGIEGVQESRGTGAAESLLRSLQREEWASGEAACLRDTVALLQGVKNHTLWAAWVWNSMQLPVGTFYGSQYHFGNFDQCLQVPWSSSHPGLRMQYCLVDVKLADLKGYGGELTDPYGDAVEYISREALRGRRLNTLSLGVCLPSTCSPASIAKVSRHLYSRSDLPLQDVEVDPWDCQVAGQKMEKKPEFYVFLYVVLAMVLVCVLVNFTTITQDNSDSTVSKILRCFCLTRNFDALTEVGKNEIRMMHGMRAFTSGILVVSHCFLTLSNALINHVDSEKHMTSKYGRLFLHIDTCVDTFLVMSGLLHIRNLLSSGSSKPVKVLCKRYLRLIVPVFALVLLCFGFVLPHLGSGPAWPRLVRKVYEPCTKSWWKNFLMMGFDLNGEGHCVDVSWYIHCDFQLTVLCTCLFLLYRKSKTGAVVAFFIAYISSAVISTAVGYWNELPGLVLYNFREAHDSTRNIVFETIYVQSYNRASAYLIGVAMGYLMTVYKPQDHRKTISKAFSIMGFIVGFSLLILVLHIGANMFDRKYSALGTAVYASLDRSIWAVGICIIIAVCEYGTLPIINKFLSSRVFVPLSKLSFSNYLWHTLFIDRSMLSLRTPMTFDFCDLVTHGMGYFVITCCFSYLFWLFVEAPSSNLINLLFDNRTAKATQNGVAKHTNGIKTEKVL